ncbi:toxin-antitoxin system YwqK family antitoxin [Glycomyces sp. NRRL B-16210]|uniref:toxin-antitoxin system YwqK family antitoxin n=1 Tax=Glycomyces sp. NRRL B-16210 TaxID=1463821 RepID=UPI000689501B|nr:hypothetical protein [Glycomyces sp. NRRL B-16210]
MVEQPEERLRIPAEDLEYHSEGYWLHNGARFTGVAFDLLPDGALDEQTYLDGYLHGPDRSFRPDGTLADETWHRHGFRHGIRREFGPDGSFIARGFEYGCTVWEVAVDADGTASLLASWSPEELRRSPFYGLREQSFHLPPAAPPSAAADLSAH